MDLKCLLIIVQTITEVERSTVGEGSMPLVSHITLTDTVFKSPSNLFAFLHTFTLLESLEMRLVDCEEDINSDALELFSTLGELVLRGECNNSIDFWLLMWIRENPWKVPILNKLAIAAVDDEGADEVTIFPEEHMLTLREVEVTIPPGNAYAWEVLREPSPEPRGRSQSILGTSGVEEILGV